ncbi:MAG: hypothetical protein E6I91_00310, partial [Chloroflexi bacterium]
MSLLPASAVCGTIQGTRVSMHAPAGVRGAHPRLPDAASSGAPPLRSKHPTRRVSHSAKESHMRKIDAFAHILPRSYLERLTRQLEKTMAPHQLDYYREGVFSFDPVLFDLDARWRKIEPYGDYAQVLVLAVPPPE